MILSSSTIDVASVFVLLHTDDVRQIGLREGDRVTVINTPKGTSVRAPVMLMESLARPGTTTITARANDKLQTQ